MAAIIGGKPWHWVGIFGAILLAIFLLREVMSLVGRVLPAPKGADI